MSSPEDHTAKLEKSSAARPSLPLVGPLLERVRSTEMGAAIVANASSLASATAVTSLLGVVYWFVAARRFTPSAVGLASAAIAAMTLVSTLASLGLGTFVLGEVPRHPNRARPLIVTALLCAGAAGVALGLGYAVIAGSVSHELHPLISSPLNATLFVGGTALVTMGLVLDQALIGQLRGMLQLYRNILFGVAKLAILVLVSTGIAHRSGMTIYASWILGALVSMVALGVYSPAWIRGLRKDISSGEFPLTKLVRELGRSVIGHQALNAALKVPLLMLPVIVVALLGARANAGFYIAWLVANFAFVLPGALSTVLYAVSTGSKADFAARLRLTLSLAFGLTIVAMLILLVGANFILSIFGPSYAAIATVSLQLLALSGLPTVVKGHYVSVMRIQGRIGRALPVVTFGAVLEVGFAAAGARIDGLTGLTAGWLIALTLQAIVMTPGVARAALDRGSAGPNGANAAT